MPRSYSDIVLTRQKPTGLDQEESYHFSVIEEQVETTPFANAIQKEQNKELESNLQPLSDFEEEVKALYQQIKYRLIEYKRHLKNQDGNSVKLALANALMQEVC